MYSFINFISNGVPYDDLWLSNPDVAFKSLTPIQKARFIYEQAVCINYLHRLYGGELSNIYKSFEEKLSTLWLSDVESHIKDSLEVNNIWQDTRVLLNKDNTNIEENNLIFEISTTAPKCLSKSFYKPYVNYLHALQNIQFVPVDNEGKDLGTYNFKINETSSIPYFNLNGHVLEVSYDQTFSSYNYNHSENKEFGQTLSANGEETIFSYLKGYNWSGTTFNGLVSILATQCLDLDTNAFPHDSIMLGFRHLYCLLFQYKSNITYKRDQYWDSSYASTFKRWVMQFLIYIRKTYNVKMDDSKLLNQFININDEDSKQLSDFLLADTPSEVSTEMYNSYKHSKLALFTELDIFKKKRLSGAKLVDESLKKKEKSLSEDLEKLEDSDEDDDKDTSDETDDIDKNLKKFDKNSTDADEDKDKDDSESDDDDDTNGSKDDSKSDDNSESGDDDDSDDDTSNDDDDNFIDKSKEDQSDFDNTSEDDDDKSDDKGDADLDSNEDENSADSDQSTDDSGSGDTENSDQFSDSDDSDKESNTDGQDDSFDNMDSMDDDSNSNSTEDNDTQTTVEEEEEKEELPEMSDEKGIEIELSTGETTDSVLYRKELKNFIENITTNPPTNLSVQKLELLKYIKANLLNLLSVKSLYNLLKAIIKLPKDIKIK